MLLVEDSLGHQEKKYLRITRVSREEIFKSEQRMLLAILPFYVTGAGAMRATICDPECLEYVYMTMRKSFKDRGRFSLVEEKTLEDVFSGDLIETACNTEEMCDENTAQQIGVSTEAEGMVCGFIQRWKGGLEIDARFREVEHGDSCLFHDIFSPVNTTEELREAVSHLAGKFHDSFPVFDGEVIDKEGQIIRVNIGEKNGLLPCMQYNVFEGGNEEDLVTRARIKLIQKETSEAEILEREKSDKVKEKGYKVRIR